MALVLPVQDFIQIVMHLWANPCSPGKMAVKMECVCALCIFAGNVLVSVPGDSVLLTSLVTMEDMLVGHGPGFPGKIAVEME